MKEHGPDAASGRLDRVLLLLLLALFLFLSPFTAWWAAAEPPWYVPFLLWAGLITLVAVTQTRRPPDDER